MSTEEPTMTDAADPGQAVERHQRTSEPDGYRVQRGWQVFDRTGQRVGRVIERDDASVVVAPGAAGTEGRRIAIRLIADEEPGGRWATLSIRARDLDGNRSDGR
jgi:hypothetical protein